MWERGTRFLDVSIPLQLRPTTPLQSPTGFSPSLPLPARARGAIQIARALPAGFRQSKRERVRLLTETLDHPALEPHIQVDGVIERRRVLSRHARDDASQLGVALELFRRRLRRVASVDEPRLRARNRAQRLDAAPLRSLRERRLARIDVIVQARTQLVGPQDANAQSAQQPSARAVAQVVGERQTVPGEQCPSQLRAASRLTPRWRVLLVLLVLARQLQLERDRLARQVFLREEAAVLQAAQCRKAAVAQAELRAHADVAERAECEPSLAVALLKAGPRELRDRRVVGHVGDRHEARLTALAGSVNLGQHEGATLDDGKRPNERRVIEGARREDVRQSGRECREEARVGLSQSVERRERLLVQRRRPHPMQPPPRPQQCRRRARRQ
eukprot:2590152-Prymnesium_polylepis.1